MLVNNLYLYVMYLYLCIAFAIYTLVTKSPMHFLATHKLINFFNLFCFSVAHSALFGVPTRSPFVTAR